MDPISVSSSAPPSDGPSSGPFALEPSSKRGLSSERQLVPDQHSLTHRVSDETIRPGDSVSQTGMSRVHGGTNVSGASRRAWLLRELRKVDEELPDPQVQLRADAAAEAQLQYEVYQNEQAALLVQAQEQQVPC